MCAAEVVTEFARIAKGFYVVKHRVGRREQVGRPVSGVDQGSDRFVYMEVDWGQPGGDVSAVKG